MSEEHKPKKEQKPKKVLYFNGRLRCQRCGNDMVVADLNTEHKVVKCAVCSFPNDIREAIKRTACHN